MISVSELAMTKLQDILKEQDAETAPVALRVYVQSGGCSGYSYGMGLDENPARSDDQIIDAGNGLRVLVDPVSAQHLEGAEVDYVDELMGGGFTIHNPNATSTCGCGHSFQSAEGGGEAKACGSH